MADDKNKKLKQELDQSKEDCFDLAKIDPDQFKIGSPCVCSLFVFVESEKKFVPLVSAGDILSVHKYSQIQHLKGSNLYVRFGDSEESSECHVLTPFDVALNTLENMLDEKTRELKAGKIFVGDAMTPEAQEIVRNVFGEMVRLPGISRPEDLSRALLMLSNWLLNGVLVDFQDIRRKLLNQLRQIHTLDDASAITTLALLVAHANGFSSKSTARLFSLAAIFCDAGLADLDRRWYDQYYKDRTQLPTHITEKIRLHPVRATELVSYSNLGTEILSQIILSHHELYNGSGYHRGLQSGTLPTTVQIFALAVDIFESLKNLELNNYSTSFMNLFKSFDERSVDPLKRRHNIRLIQGIFSFLGIRS